LIHPGAPYVLSRTPWAIRRRPPLTGEHSEEVLRQWRTTGGREAATAPAMGGALQRPAGPLTGCRIADFSWMVAGPLTTRILADFGAEVIKIEAPRRRPNTNPPAGLFGALNRGKRSIAVDMTTSAGVALAKRLIAASDVVVDNFSARVLQNWGLDDVTLHHLNPQLVRLRMSGFGLTGPYRDRVSYGPTLQALCGHTWLMRGETGAIAGWGFSYADMVAGLSGAFAVLAALWYRRSSGVGQQIDLSQFENLATLLGPRFLDILVNGSPWPPIGNHSQELAAAPHGIYRCADRPGSGPARDRWCALAVFGDDDWLRFRRAVGEPAWSYDPRFAHHADRWHNRAQLDARVEEWTRGRRAETVAACLQDAGLAAAVVADAEDLRRRDPQLGAPGYWVCRGAREGKEAAVDGTPLRLFQTQPRLRTGAPFSGEHTDVLLRQILGLTAAEVTALHAERVVA
jgi:crotonobetainyl-CoA:carnitine CoA-transferase CaiB-like acyl-CoA transferase